MFPSSKTRPPAATQRGRAVRFVLLIGLLSFFSDMTHEGSRSILGPFLGSMQASAFAIAGYIIQLASVPAMAGVLAYQADYRHAFAVLAIPAAVRTRRSTRRGNCRPRPWARIAPERKTFALLQGLIRAKSSQARSLAP